MLSKIFARPFLWVAILASLVSTLSLSTKTILLNEAPFDLLVPLDAGIRLHDGIIPNLDYPSSIGPLYAAVHALAMWAGGVDARAVIWANNLVLGICGCLLAIVLRGAPKLVQITVLVLVIGTLLVPVDLDVFPPDYRYVANYNNWAWGFLAVVITWTLRAGPVNWLCDLALGLALVCLFYLKLPSFCGALLLLPLGLFLDRRRQDYVVPGALLLLAIAAGAWLGQLAPYLADNMAVALASNLIRAFKFEWQVVALFNIPVTIVMAIICYRPGLTNKVVVILLAAWLILNLTALQNNFKMIPVIGMPLLLLSPRLTDISRYRLSAPAVMQAAVLILACLIGLAIEPMLMKTFRAYPLGDSGTLGERILLSATRGGGDWVLSPADDTLPDTDEIVHREFLAARDLIAGQSGRVLALAFANDALVAWPAAKPAIGAPLWYDLGRSFSTSSFPPPNRVFLKVDLVLAPKRHRSNNTRQLMALYQPWLDKCATLVAQNDLWRLYKPNTDGSASCPNPGASENKPLLPS